MATQLALHYAAISSHGEVVSLLLERSAELEPRPKNGTTALLYAAVSAHSGVVPLLLERGAKLETKSTHHGDTALYFAAWSGDGKVVSLLLEHGVNLEAKNNYGFTALHYATKTGHGKVVSLLLERGAELEAKRNNGDTALNFVRFTRLASSATTDDACCSRCDVDPCAPIMMVLPNHISARRKPSAQMLNLAVFTATHSRYSACSSSAPCSLSPLLPCP